MTAEVGILNANGVVLAADSALTMGNSEQMKIFNSGNKIFSLGPSHSVAMMMFGNVQFMGIPWEIIVTGFHQKNRCPAIGLGLGLLYRIFQLS